MRTTTADPGLDSPLGRYRLIALLGQGGMADVYLACTQGAGGFQKLLVVKLARFTGDPVFATMFLSEARLAAQLSHPNIVQTFEIGEEGTRHYIVMEYLDGGNLARLRQRMVKQGGIPLRLSLHILMQVLEALEYAHEATGIDGKELKVVHRDLSPSNIMVTAQGVVKILDFGIAKAADSASFTQTGKFSGKLEYMPPEQLRGERVDMRADIFSFGVILAESVLGEKLWGGTGGPTIAAELGSGRIPSLDRGKEFDPELKRICEKALAPDRANRYATTAELKADLAAYVATLGAPATQKELAQFVRATVEDDRAKLQAVIDNQLQRISLLTWGGETPPPDLPKLEHTPSQQPDYTVQDRVIEEDSGKVSIIEHSRPPAPARTSPVKWLAIGGALSVATILAIVALGRGGSGEATKAAPPPATGAPPAPAQPEAPAAPPVATTARLEIVVSPADATLVLDGKPVANPYVATLPKDTASHELQISAAGYQTLRQQFALDRDLNFRLSLEREATPAATPTAAATRTRTRATPPPPKRTAPPPPPPAAVVTAPAVVPPPVKPPETAPADGKRSLDGDVYGKTPSKRSLDSNVLDNGNANKPKPSLDRDNPWKK